MIEGFYLFILTKILLVREYIFLLFISTKIYFEGSPTKVKIKKVEYGLLADD